jgi:ribosomal protein S18 acetylase RimI-like enzyme
MPIDIKIIEVKESTDSIVSSINKLLPQLTSKFKGLDRSTLQDMLNSESSNLFIAIDELANNKIIGTYTLVIFRIPTGDTARIEDVVVDEKWRGKGIGKKMMEHAIQYLQKNGITKIELTSHHSRIAANQLYQSLGFRQIETNVYRMYL